MGRDKVLGLSLAILLIGFAAAFCFRNEPFVESGLKLARAKILDEAIAQRPGPKPYATDPKAERTRSSLPTVTLQGIESVEPFSDLQSAQSTERERSTIRIENQKGLDKTNTRADIKLSAQTRVPANDATISSDAEPAPIDSDRAASEIGTSRPAPVAVSAVPVVEISPASSKLLTSAPPPTDEPSNGESQAPSADIVIRPNLPPSHRTESLVPQSTAWQSTPAHRPRGPLADNAPRNGAAPDDPTGDNPTGENPVRDNPTREDRTRDNPEGEKTIGENPTREVPPVDHPISGNPKRDDLTSDNPTSDSAARENPAYGHPSDGNPAAEKPAGNVPSGETESSPKSVTYRVRRGDTLTKIALHYFGDSSRYRQIFEANRDQLRSPNDRLKIGMTLRIPANAARTDRVGGSVGRRKSRSNRSGHAMSENSRPRQTPSRDGARVREMPPSATQAGPPDPPSNERTNSDPAGAIRFIPVRRAPFLPANKADSDQAPPAENRDSGSPDMSQNRSSSTTESVRLAGDREDATVR